MLQFNGAIAWLVLLCLAAISMSHSFQIDQSVIRRLLNAEFPLKLPQNSFFRSKSLSSVARIRHRDELYKNIFSEGLAVKQLDVRGDIAEALRSSSEVHPIVKLLHERKRIREKQKRLVPTNSSPSVYQDDARIALAIEGGGMRGCVSAGMAAAISYLGLVDSFDAIYGSSAGAVVGAYLVAGQFPLNAPAIYYNTLTTRSKSFLDKKNLIRSTGFGFLDFRPRALINMILKREKFGPPVLNLDFVCEEVMRSLHPLNWTEFWNKQSILPLHVIASGLYSEKSIALSAQAGNFQSLEELAQCIKASMALPGITGQPVQLLTEQVRRSHNFRTNLAGESEPFSDALLFEPLPYRSAMNPNESAVPCTHAVVLRSRPDNISVTVPMSFLERRIMKRFFTRKLLLPRMTQWMLRQYHKLLYAEDILRLNEENRKMSQVQQPKLFGVALPSGIAEVSRTETNRARILFNVKYGFAAAYDALVEEFSLRGQGWKIANELWPDTILDTENPCHTSCLANKSKSTSSSSTGDIAKEAEKLKKLGDKLFGSHCYTHSTASVDSY